MRLSLFIALFAFVGLSACDTVTPEAGLDSAIAEVPTEASAEKALGCAINGPSAVLSYSTSSYSATSACDPNYVWRITGNATLGCDSLTGGTQDTEAAKSGASSSCTNPTAYAGSFTNGDFTITLSRRGRFGSLVVVASKEVDVVKRF